MTNQALDINPPNATFAFSTRGSNFAWAWFAVFTLVLLGLIASVFAVERSQRVFHRVAILIMLVYLICYFLIASDLGSTPIAVEFRADTILTRFYAYGRPTRQIWYVRWVMYALNFPLIIYMLLLATGRPISEYITSCAFALTWAVSFLIGALIRSSYKWGMFTMGMVAMFVAMYELLVPGARSAARLGGDYRTAYVVPALLFTGIWLLYPLAFGLDEGGNVIRVTSGVIFYGILDICIIFVVVLVFLGLVSSVDHSQYESHRWGAGETDPLWEKPGRHHGRGQPSSGEAPAPTSRSVETGQMGTSAPTQQQQATAPVAPALEGQNAA